MKTLTVLVGLFLLTTSYELPPAYAAGEPGLFMYGGVGGRAMGLGGAYTGIVNDSFATYYNPGALGMLEYKEIGTFQSILFEDTQFTFLSYVHPTLNKGVYGVSVTRLFSGGADKRDDNNVDVGSFNDSQMAVGISYGRNIYKDVYWGVTAKYLNHSIDTFTQNAFTTDTGLFLPMSKSLTLGFNVQNVIARYLSETDDVLPIVFRAGCGYHLFNDKLLVALDLTHKSQNALIDDYSIGLESVITKLLRLRIGSNTNETTVGFGVAWKGFSLDYAMVMHFLGTSHNISLTARFGPSLSDLRKAGAGEEEAPEADNAELELSQEKFREVFQGAIALYRRGLYKQSLDKFNVAQSLDPKDMDVPLYQDRIGMLVPIVPQVISPDKTSELLRRGITYFIEGDGKSAVKTVAYSLSTEPDNFTISRVLSRIEESSGVKADYSKPVSGMSTVDEKLFEALIAFRKKDYAYTINLCEEVLILEPQNTMAMKRLGSAFFALGDKEKAVATWKKSLELDPSDSKLQELMNKIQPEAKK